MALYAFNGTWNSEKTEDVATEVLEYELNTNVKKFCDAYIGDGTFYTNGVGTRVGVLGKIIGGAFGVGGQHRLADAVEHLQKRLAAGDKTIDVVGFSRGAALALAFTNRVHKHVTDPSTGKPPVIRFLGLWDVVGSFGFPINLGPLKFQEYNLGYSLDLCAIVQHCYHAMALDERRQTFRVTRLKGALELWFRGAHSDVGGGNGNLGLNNIALCWMLKKALASGLPIDQSKMLAAETGRNPAATVKWPKDLIKQGYRTLSPEDRYHYTVTRSADRTLNDPPDGFLIEDAVAELRSTVSQAFTV